MIGLQTRACDAIWQGVLLQEHVMPSLAQPMFSQKQVAPESLICHISPGKKIKGYTGHDRGETHD